MNIQLSMAKPLDFQAVCALLEQASLPVSDLPPALQGFTLAVTAEGKLVGVAGVETFGQTGLLRSVAVAPEVQGQNIGSQLFDSALAYARAQGLEALYLITNTAAPYFERKGFRTIARQDAPAAIQATQQFAGLCPSSATVMQLTL